MLNNLVTQGLKRRTAVIIVITRASDFCLFEPN